MNPGTAIALVATMIFWGSSFVATKMILAEWPSWAYMFLRFAFASLLFLVVLIRKRQLKLPRKVLPKILLVAMFEPGLYFLFETLGLERTGAASSSILIAAIPAVVALFSAIFLKEHLSLRGWIGTLLSIAGIAVITLFGSHVDQSESSFAGNLFIILAIFSATGYIILARSISSQVSPLQLTAYQLFFATIFFLPGIIIQGPQMMQASFSGQLIFAFVFLVIGATFTAFLSYNYALSKIPAPQAAVFINGIPVVTVVVAWLVLGETLNLIQIMGGILAVGGLMLANRRETAKINIEA